METRHLSTLKPLVHFTDKCREWRFTVRRVREMLDQTNREVGSRYVIVSTASAVACLFDKALTTLESGVIAAISSDAERHKGKSRAYPITAHLPVPTTEASADAHNVGQNPADNDDAREHILQFSAEQYFMAKRILQRADIKNYLLYQSSFNALWERIQPDSSDRNALVNASDAEQVACRAAAKLAVQCVQCQPLAFPKTVPSPLDDTEMDANEFLSASLALVGLVSSINRVEAADQQAFDSMIFENCIDTVLAKPDDIHRSLNASDAESAMYSFLMKWCQRLP